MVRCTFDQLDDLRNGRFAESLAGPHADESRDVDATRDDLVALHHIARSTFARQCHGVEAGLPFDDLSVEGHLLARTDDDGFAHGYLFGSDGHHLALTFHVGRIGTDVHQVRNRFAALSFGIAFKEFADLEEEHHEDGFGELCLGTWEESDAESAQCRDGHEEVFVKWFAFHHAFDGFLDGVKSHYEVGDKIDEQQLPGGQCVVVLDIYCDEEQNDGHCNLDDRFLHSTFVMMVVMMMSFFIMVVVMMPFVIMFVVVMVMMFVRMRAALASLFVFIVMMMVMMFVCHIFTTIIIFIF